MQLVFDEEDDEGQEEAKCTGGEDPRAPADTRLSSGRGPQEASGNPGWDAGGITRVVVITCEEGEKTLILVTSLIC